MEKTSHLLRVSSITLAAFAVLAITPCLAEETAAAAETSAAQIPADQAAARQAYIDQSFKKIDTNGDGSIDKQEWHDFMVAYMERQNQDFTASFEAADTNGDGKLSRKEAQAANPLLHKYFDDIDTDGNGFITPDEIRAAMLKKQMESVEAPEANAPKADAAEKK